MQKGSFKPYSLRYDSVGVIERINALAKKCRSNNIPVFFIQHDGSKENCLYPKSDDWQLLPELKVLPSDITIGKTANDAFYDTPLDLSLRNKHITELLITGCATDFCVDTTVKSALSKDYKVVVVADAHTTAARPHIEAETVIKHYNWLWSDMSPTKHKISVIKAAEIEL